MAKNTCLVVEKVVLASRCYCTYNEVSLLLRTRNIICLLFFKPRPRCAVVAIGRIVLKCMACICKIRMRTTKREGVRMLAS